MGIGIGDGNRKVAINLELSPLTNKRKQSTSPTRPQKKRCKLYTLDGLGVWVEKTDKIIQCLKLAQSMCLDNSVTFGLYNNFWKSNVDFYTELATSKSSLTAKNSQRSYLVATRN